MRNKFLIAAAVSVLMGTAAHAGVSVITDGTFTEGSSAGSYTNYASGTSFGPWTSEENSANPGTATSVDLIGSAWATPYGVGSVDLNGTNTFYGGANAQAEGALAQTFNASVAGSYVLTFYLSGNDAVDQNAKSLNVELGGQTVPFTSTNSVQAGTWTLETATFVLAQGSNTLEFESTYPGGAAGSQANNFGAVIADVSLTRVPEPATWAMLILGMGGLGAALRRRRKVALLAA